MPRPGAARAPPWLAQADWPRLVHPQLPPKPSACPEPAGSASAASSFAEGLGKAAGSPLLCPPWTPGAAGGRAAWRTAKSQPPCLLATWTTGRQQWVSLSRVWTEKQGRSLSAPGLAFLPERGDQETLSLHSLPSLSDIHDLSDSRISSLDFSCLVWPILTFFFPQAHQKS